MHKCLILALFSLFFLPAFSQENYIEGFSWRERTSGPCATNYQCGAYDMLSWDDTQYKEFAYVQGNLASLGAHNFMNFRVIYPVGYNQNAATEYPVIVMLHGAGESGRTWTGSFNYASTDNRYDNNSNNLKWGGTEHRDAVNRPSNNSRAFPGFVIFPQHNFSGNWQTGYNNGVLDPAGNARVIKFIEWMIANKKVDRHRIYVHGLSQGAKGTWDIVTKRPDLFAALLPMSGVPASNGSGVNNNTNADGKVAAADSTYTFPTWLFQGGLDTNPSPGAATSIINAIKAKGGNPIYTLYPSLGHGTWTSAYAEPNFFSWILSQSRKNIYVPGGATAICGSTPIKLYFNGYKCQWYKDGILQATQTQTDGNLHQRQFTATAPGNYTVTFRRRTTATNPDLTVYTSNILTIGTATGPTITPVITNSGSVILPVTNAAGGGITGTPDNGVKLFGPAGYSSYEWFQNGISVGTTSVPNFPSLNDGSTPSFLTTGHGSTNATPPSTAGDYTLKVMESSGCQSNFSSTIKIAFNTNGWVNNGHTLPAATSPSVPTVANAGAPGTPTFSAIASNSITVTWADNSTNESYFEIWRTRNATTGVSINGSPTLVYAQQLYKLVGKVAANTTSFVDANNGIRPGARYFYTVRAVGIGSNPTDGKLSAQSPQGAATLITPIEIQAPSIPVDFVITGVTDNTISVQWSTATDNDVVYGYEVFLGANQVVTIPTYLRTDTGSGDQTDGNPAPSTTYTFTGLDPGTTYTVNVRSVDYSLNKSAFPQALVATTTNTAGISLDFYSIPGQDLSLTTSWTSNANGTGGNPGDFTSPNQYFYVQGASSLTDDFLTVSGASSRIVVSNGATLNVDNELTANVYAMANSIININFDPSPNLVDLNESSTVNLNAGSFVPSALYGNLNLTNPGTLTLPVGSTVVKGNLTISNGITLSGVTGNQSSLTVGKDLILNGTSNFISTPTNRVSIFFSGVDPNKNHTLSVNNQDLSFFGFQTDFSDIVTLNFNTATPRNLNISGIVRLKLDSRIVLGQNNLVVVNGANGFNPDSDGGEVSINGGNFTLNTTAVKTSSLFFTQGQNSIYNLSITSPTTNILNELTVSNLVTLNGNLYITDNVKLISNATNTARIGPLVSSTITGNINFQRYMAPKGRVYRYISSPIVGTKAADIQASGIPITGAFTGNNNTLAGSSQASMFWYNATLATPAYVAFPAATNQETLVKGRGYSLFMRSNQFPATTWSTTGDVNQGNFSFDSPVQLMGPVTASPTGGYSLLGNPYPAPIQWTGSSTGGWTMTGVSSTVSVRENNAALPGGYQFLTWNGSAGNFSGLIASGQAFWVQSTSASPTLSITENAKAPATNAPIYREESPYVNALEITLAKGTLKDQTYLQTSSGAKGAFDKIEDGAKQMNSYFSVYSKSDDGVPVAINVIEDTYCQKNIVLAFDKVTTGNYTLSFAGFDTFYQGLKGKLKDTFSATEAELNASLVYNFSIDDAIPASKAAGRFVLSLVRTDVQTNLSLEASAVCEASPSVVVIDPQAGMQYQAFYNGSSVSDKFTANNNRLNLSIDKSLLGGIGKHTITVKAYNSCGDQYTIEKTATLTIDSLVAPQVTSASGLLTSSSNQADAYQWYRNDEVVIGANQATYTPVESGSYAVNVSVNACSKTSDAIEFTALQTDQLLTASEPACEITPTVTIANPQPEAQYQAFVGTIAVSEKFIVPQESDSVVTLLSLALNSELMTAGTYTVQVKSTLKDGQSKFLTQTSQVRVDALASPEIQLAGEELTTTVKNADQYQWYFEGQLMENETSSSLTPVVDGTYSVKVKSNTCVKTSPEYHYSIAGLGEAIYTTGVYPNPFTKTITVTLPKEVAGGNAVLYNTLGQPIHTVKLPSKPSSKVELDLTAPPSGYYILEIDSYRFKVIKKQ